MKKLVDRGKKISSLTLETVIGSSNSLPPVILNPQGEPPHKTTANIVMIQSKPPWKKVCSESRADRDLENEKSLGIRKHIKS